MVHRLYEQSLHSAALELKYEASTHLIDIITKDEDIRLLRCNLHILQDDNDELRDLLTQEETRSDTFERLVTTNLHRAETAESQLTTLTIQLHTTQQDLTALQAEARALQSTATTAEAFLTEKLALTRELSTLRPQLTHLQTQATTAETLLSEKLDLQRQLTALQCEVENAKREAKRALAKRRNTGIEIARDQELEDLRRDLAREQRARRRAEEAVDATSMDVGIDEVRKELAREKRARQKVEEELEVLREGTLVEDVRRELVREKKGRARAEREVESSTGELERVRSGEVVGGANGEVEELRKAVVVEKKERLKVEKMAQKAAMEFEAQKTTLEEKLDQFRTKLRSTKEKLKAAEAELVTARETAIAAPAKVARTDAASRKRNVAQLEPDAVTLRTPGDGPVAKRSRKFTASIGDKSTFSLTPFLNKTASIIPTTPDSDVDQDADAQDMASPIAIEANKKQRKVPLAAVSASEANIQKKTVAKQRKPKPAAALDIVAEEAANDPATEQENAITTTTTTTTTVQVKNVDGPGHPDHPVKQQKRKVRKSLVDFATFTVEPEPEKKKKRKLGGLGKTLFDEDDDGAPMVKTIPNRSLFGGKSGGVALGLGGKKAGGLLGSSKIGSTLLTAADGSGFQFSPLKRSRKNLDDTLRG